jgi:hypothetical protein
MLPGSDLLCCLRPRYLEIAHKVGGRVFRGVFHSVSLSLSHQSHQSVLSNIANRSLTHSLSQSYLTLAIRRSVGLSLSHSVSLSVSEPIDT